MTFIDLFAGLGGFHLALAHLGHECVWACESAKKLRRLYAVNFPGTPIAGDITKVAVEDIPAHDILCAGFPCQPFSLAGKKEGFDDEKGRGNLFRQVCRVAAFHRPTYLLLENVKQLFHHDGGRTWAIMQEHLQQLGYGVSMAILSPHQFGIPQHRERVYIVCQYGKTAAEMAQFPFPEPTNTPTDIGDFLHPDATLLRPV
ncbi:MAG: DNA (cytosine-5-)-methyltransferase, partial [Bacteroidaceae bacterium]|nr:DNA (cytosine-5-)-methyltransferase [Bacteroidaceae bacterium]